MNLRKEEVMTIRTTAALILAIGLAEPAAAYVGGPAVATIGTLIAVFGSVILALGVVLARPVLRLFGKGRRGGDEAPARTDGAAHD